MASDGFRVALMARPIASRPQPFEASREVSLEAVDTDTSDEQAEAELDQFNIRLHEAQKLQGRTFVSRTAVMDPRRGAGGKAPRKMKTTVLRVVVNAQVRETASDASRLLPTASDCFRTHFRLHPIAANRFSSLRARAPPPRPPRR